MIKLQALRAALAYVGLISVVQTVALEQTHKKKNKLYTACLGDKHRASAATLSRQSAQKTCELVMRSVVYDNPSEECF